MPWTGFVGFVKSYLRAKWTEKKRCVFTKWQWERTPISPRNPASVWGKTLLFVYALEPLVISLMWIWGFGAAMLE